MSETIQLLDAVCYSKEKVLMDSLTLDNYVTTDNLIQNKLGRTCAVSLPPGGGKFTAYKEQDILVVNIRPYLKKIWFSDRDGGYSPDVLVFKTKEDHDSKFIYYAMFRDDFFTHIMNGSKGTKMPRGDKNQIMNFTVPLFEKPKQQKIAAVLSALDAKIELNNRINAELEAMAKTLYDYWFVQFDFPDKNGKPYKTSGGKMVYNETLKRPIPEGWEVKELGKIANITMGQSPSGKTYNEKGDGEVFFQGSTDFGWRFPIVRKFTTKSNRMAKQGDILLSVRAPVGTINIANDDCCIGRGLASISSKDGNDGFLLYAMRHFEKVFDRLNGAGTTFGSITKGDLFSLNITNPEMEQLRAYNEIVVHYNQMIHKRNLQNQTLTQLRDWLLPMLMNGQITVK